MKIEVIIPKGYCAGVTLALKEALKAKEENKDKDVYVLGMLVHNEESISFLKEKGIINLTNKDNDHFKLIKQIPNGSVIVFTAHGHDERLDKIAKDKDLIIYDATCSKVKDNMSEIKRRLTEGYKVIYIGKKSHPETEASLSISKDVLLFDEKLLINYQLLTNSKVFVTNQTTLNYAELEEIHKRIKDVFPTAYIQDEVCATTRLRQEKLRNLDKDVDFIYVVGSNKSNNSVKLFEIAKSLYGEDKVRLIQTKEDIIVNEIKNKNHIVISSGASTPPKTIDMIYEFLSNL